MQDIEANEIKPNSNEVSALKYLNSHKIKELIKENDKNFTPWFKLITKSSSDIFKMYFNSYLEHHNNPSQKNKHEKTIFSNPIKQLEL